MISGELWNKELNMAENDIPTAEEVKEDMKKTTERVSVAGNDLIKTVQALLREAAVRKITVQDKNGRTLIEFPLYAGIIGAVFVGSWTVLALIAAWFAEVSILIERDVQSDGEAADLGEAVDQAAESVSDRAASAADAAKSGIGGAAAAAKSGIGGAIGTAARGASDLARRAADSLEGRMRPAGATDDLMEQGEQAAQAIIEAAEAAAAPRQCAALTKSGTRCKRNAVAGSDYCSTHQPK